MAGRGQPGQQRWKRLTILGAWLQAKGEGHCQVETAEAPPPPLPKLGMDCVASSSAIFFALMLPLWCALGRRFGGWGQKKLNAPQDPVRMVRGLVVCSENLTVGGG